MQQWSNANLQLDKTRPNSDKTNLVLSKFVLICQVTQLPPSSSEFFIIIIFVRARWKKNCGEIFHVDDIATACVALGVFGFLAVQLYF